MVSNPNPESAGAMMVWGGVSNGQCTPNKNGFNEFTLVTTENL